MFLMQISGDCIGSRVHETAEICRGFGAGQKGGAPPRSSWQMSGSGVYIGCEWCRMYCVEWKVLKASPFRKSRGCSRPATGWIFQPVACLRSRSKQSLRLLEQIRTSSHIRTAGPLVLQLPICLAGSLNLLACKVVLASPETS